MWCAMCTNSFPSPSHPFSLSSSSFSELHSQVTQSLYIAAFKAFYILWHRSRSLLRQRSNANRTIEPLRQTPTEKSITPRQRCLAKRHLQTAETAITASIEARHNTKNSKVPTRTFPHSVRAEDSCLCDPMHLSALTSEMPSSRYSLEDASTKTKNLT